MAATRFIIKDHAVLEMNRAAYLKNGLVVSQTPLSDEFTEESPCENGMWVDANKANGEIKLISENTVLYGIVYTTEKDYTGLHPELRHFYQKGGDYPRVGVLHEGDTFTTNCFTYNFTDTTNVLKQKKELEDALKAGPLYVVPTVGGGAPEVTATKPTEGAYAQVVKIYTVPNGDPGIKYVMLHV